MIAAMRPEEPVYQARYGEPGITLTGLIASLVMIVLGCLDFIHPPLISAIFPLWLSLAGGVISLAAVLSASIGRQVAFGIDQSGITFGGHPLRYRATTRHIPWADIRQITLWTREVSLVNTSRGPSVTLFRYRYIGLIRYPGTPDLYKGRLSRWLFGMPPVGGPPGIAAGTARRISTWKLDRARLKLAVSNFAPSVPVVDLRPGNGDCG